MKNCLLATLLLGFSLFCAAQQQTTNWAFGTNAGLNFDLESGVVTPILTSINTSEGCSSISDDDGNLLFYTDGRTVWNRNNQIMSNANYFDGTGLLGDPSSTSSGVIVPHPTNDDLYYIFTVDEPHHNNAWAFPNQGPADINGTPINFYEETFGDFQTVPNNDDGFNNGLNYTLVDMSLNGGLGDVDPNEKNIHLVTYDPNDPVASLYKCAEKITAVQGADCESFWVITQFIDKFYVFKIDANGFTNLNPVVSNALPPNITTLGYRRNAIGYVKSSPDGTKIAICHNQNGNFPSDDNFSENSGSFWIYDFDNETGEVSNPVNLLSNIQTYGTEFSADSKKLYVTGGNAVRQFDLANNNAQTVVFQGSNFLSSMQLGPNNKIYVCNNQNPGSLDVIERPNLPGLQCQYNIAGQPLALGSSAGLGLPPFITSLLISQIDIIRNGESTTELKLCDGDSYTLNADDLPDADYTWFKDGVELAETSFELEIDSPGLYELILDPNNGRCPTEGSAVVGIFEIPVANSANDIIVCDEDNNGQEVFDFVNTSLEILGSQDSNTFQITYYLSDIDAQREDNPINLPFISSSQEHEIFARIDNINNTGCFDITAFKIQVAPVPIYDDSEINLCDEVGDIFDGLTGIDLASLALQIESSLSIAQANISFHGARPDAEQNINALPQNYTNTNPFSETVFVRIENSILNSCFSISEIELIINPAPTVQDLSIFQCDEDGNPNGITQFNLTELSSEISDNESNRIVEFYLNASDAANELNPIDGTNFTNSTPFQVITTRVTNSITGCINFGSLTLEVSSTSANNASIQLCDADGLEDGFVEFNLSEADELVLAGLPEGLDLSYYPSYEDALLETNILPLNYTNALENNDLIFARVENANACYGISEVRLEVLSLPDIETAFSTIYCLNEFPATITLDAGIINDLPNNYRFEWSTGATTSEIEINAPGTYSVDVYNVLGCFKTRTIVVEASNIASIENIEVTDATENNSIMVVVSGEGSYEFSITSAEGPYQDEGFFDALPPELYTIYVRDKLGCGILEKEVSVIGFPKFFTPNGDGVNDIWQIKGLSSRSQINGSIDIFDRFGKLIQRLDPLGPGWTGDYNGNQLPANDYWFKAQLQDGRVFTSHFSLRR